MSDMAVMQDLRRDAVQLLIEDIGYHILDVGLEDIPKEDDIQMLMDHSDEDEWFGIFTNDNNAERMYEVKYRYDVGKFFITTFLMTFCKKVDPPHLY